jgi:hypothetical protein
MATTVYPNFLLSTKINRLHFMLPILFAIIVSLICAQFVLLSEPIRNSTTMFDGVSEFLVVINVFIIVILSMVSLFVFFRIFNKNPHFALRIVVAAFILGGMLSTLLFGKLVFSLLHLNSPLLLIVVAFVAYVGVYFAYLSIVDALSDRMKNLLFVFCSGALGSFLGVLLPAVPVVGISLFLSALDFLLIRRKTVENIVGEETYEKLVFNVAISNEDWGIGIGDLTCYSMVVSSTSVTFGFSMGIVSLLLILVGSLISITLTLRRVRLPGLPIPVALGLIPSIMLFFS